MNALTVYALLKSKVSALTTRAETAATNAENSAISADANADRAEAAATIAQNLSQTIYMDSDDGLLYIDIED